MRIKLNSITFIDVRLVAFFFIVNLISINLKAQNWLPHNYWTFDGTNPLTDSMSRSNLDPTFYNSPYTIASTNVGNGVGKYLNLSSSSRIIVASEPLDADTGYTIEFLYRGGANINQTIQLFSRRDGALNIRLYFPYFRFTTKSIPTGSTSITSDTWDLYLEDIGRGSYSYYMDGNWHHLVFKYDAKNGKKEIWVDGQLPAGFSKTLTPGKVPSNTTSSGNSTCDINTITDYYKYEGDLDEIAMYKYALPDNMVYKHYTEFVQKKHFSFSNSTVTPPPAASLSGTLDMNEFAPGHPNANVDALIQLKTFPAARVSPLTTLFPNTMVFNPANVAGEGTSSFSMPTLIQRSKEVQIDLVTNYGYALLVSTNAHQVEEFGDTNAFDGAYIKLGNLNPQWKTSANTYWPQLNPQKIGKKSADPYVSCQCLPSNSYLRNSSGQFLDRNGNVNSSSRLISPESPLDSLVNDGKTMRYYLDELTKKMTRPLNTIFENGEVIPFWTSSALSKDPTTLAAYNSSGLSGWGKYIGKGMKRLTTAYTNQFLTLPALSNTRFSHFFLNGHPIYSWDWQNTREINTLVNGQRYSAGDIYMNRPDFWRFWSAASHGWQFVVESRHEEILLGDKLYSPAVCAGWDDEEKIPRPAQWLGFLKVIGMSGAEYFQTGYFVLKQPYQNPSDYVWQMAIPGYAKGISSRYEDLLWNGYLMQGDVPLSPTSSTVKPGYSFYAGDMRKLVVGRKHNTLNKYAITGTIQPLSNEVGNTELNSTATIRLDNANLTFNIRRQGSTYIYDKSNPSMPIFYQLDGWHEEKHPYYWSKNFNLEGELYDNVNANAEIRTYVPAGTSAGNYTNFTSCVGFKSVASVEYNFVPRGTTTANHYVWVRARSKTGVKTGMTLTLDGTINNRIDCINDTTWTWYKFDASSNTAIFYPNLSLKNHKLTITANNTGLEIDLITITPSSSNIYSSFAPICGTTSSFNPAISSSSSTTFCQGGNITLTATTGVSYLWSTGATTQQIVVNTAGTYSVTVNNGTQTGVSAPLVVTVNTAPSTTITTSGATTLCPGASVTLTSGATSGTFLWSTGATTQSINVNTAGNYSVRVTGTNGCTSNSTVTTVSLLSSVVATITASGSTSICQGRFVTLTANSGASYLWSNGATTQSINVTTAGSYSVTVTQAGGCSKTSSPTTVTVNSAAVNTVTASGSTTLCTGSSVTLTSGSTSGTYLWSTGATTKSITVSISGNYLVTTTNTNGCSATSATIPVTALTSATATITASGSTSICQGNSVTLSANNGSSYLWSNGQTTQAIVVSTAGSYSVTVSQSGGCSKTSTPTSVIVNSVIANSISASGATSFCNGGSVTLTSSATSGSYLWSNGATTKSITVSTSGVYINTVTATSGCKSVSNSISVNASGSSTPATITASGATSFCEGGSVNLTASNGASYLWSNGATTQTITVINNGNFTVSVTQAGGCSSTSAPTTVTVLPRANFVVTPSGPLNFCNGGSVTFNVTQTNGQAFVWYKNNSVISTSTTSGNYTANSAGKYKLRVQLNTCGNFSNEYNVTVPCRDGELLPKTSLTAYPNPFNQNITFAYSVEEPGNVTIRIYDISGKVINVLVNDSFSEIGEFKIEYNGENLSQGIYFAEIINGNNIERVKISCIK